MGPTVSVRTGDRFNVSLRWSRNDVDLPVGHFIANLTSARLAYNFSPRRFVQALVQYNDAADLWSANLRVGLLGQANTGLFIVYNDTRGLHDTIPSGGGRSLILKFSRLFDLVTEPGWSPSRRYSPEEGDRYRRQVRDDLRVHRGRPPQGGLALALAHSPLSVQRGVPRRAAAGRSTAIAARSGVAVPESQHEALRAGSST